MNRELNYNNKILSEQERIEFCKKSDEFINQFSEFIEEIHQLAKEVPKSENTDFDKIVKISSSIGTFIGYTFCDCIVLTKLFVMATNSYEKSFLRGKLKVQLNEGFKKLYGYNKKKYKDSYCAQLENIITYFPGFKAEFGKLSSDLEQISKNPWWKEERNTEVHIDATKLYELRHEEINESKVAMEASILTDLFNRFNNLIARMLRALLDHINCKYGK